MRERSTARKHLVRMEGETECSFTMKFSLTKSPSNSCCGPDGTCGYGPDFCGTGCSSNCDAVAMCGKYADPATDGKCGMNLCCSWGMSLDIVFVVVRVRTLTFALCPRWLVWYSRCPLHWTQQVYSLSAGLRLLRGSSSQNMRRRLRHDRWPRGGLLSRIERS